jgi:hypothetical protein
VRKIAGGSCSVREWAAAVGWDHDIGEMRGEGEGEGRREEQDDKKRRREWTREWVERMWKKGRVRKSNHWMSTEDLSSTVDEVQSKMMTDRRERKKKRLRGRGKERGRETVDGWGSNF